MRIYPTSSSQVIFEQFRKAKIKRNEKLTDGELMEFIILPLSYRKKEEKEKRVREAVDLAVRIRDRKQQVFALAGIPAFADKVIDRETADRIRRVIEMTQVAMIFEEEKWQAVEAERKAKRQAVEAERKAKWQAVEAERKAKQQAVEAERKKAFDFKRQTIVNMLERGFSTEEIVSMVSGSTKKEVEALRKLSKKNK